MGRERIESLIGGIVLLYYEDQPAAYARIEAIAPDVKKNWYQVTLLLLTIPAKQITWILREEYIRGGSFTMGGKSMKLEAVPPYKPPEPKEQGGPSEPKENGAAKTAKVVPFRKTDKGGKKES